MLVRVVEVEDPGHWDDRGAVVVLFALVMGAGVLFSMVALVFDVGQAYVARRDAQNTSDIIALSMAYECVRSSSTCSNVTAMQAKADGLATDNATGKRVYSTITELCGSSSGTCSALSATQYDCRAPGSNARFVRVRMTGSSSSGSVPQIFAPVIGKADQLSVSACAQAGWGQVSGAPIKVPILFSICDFNQTSPQLLREWKTGTAGCTTTDLDGKPQNGNFRGFATLKRNSGDTREWYNSQCSNDVQFTVGDFMLREASDICTGLITAVYRTGLEAKLAGMLNNPTLVPVTRNTGTGTPLLVVSFAQFTLLGYTIGPSKFGSSTISWPSDCGAPGASASGNKCIYGSYSKAVIPYQQIDYTVPNLGINTVVALP